MIENDLGIKLLATCLRQVRTEERDGIDSIIVEKVWNS